MSDTTKDQGYEKPKVERYGDFRELTRAQGWGGSSSVEDENSRS